MVSEDRLTAEPALTLKDATVLQVTSANQAANLKAASIKRSAETREDGRFFKPRPEYSETKEKKRKKKNKNKVNNDTMSETVTRHKHHLWLSAEPEQDVPANITRPVARVPDHSSYDSEVIIRSPTNITLDVNVRVGGTASCESAFNIALSAGKCSLLSDLRAHIVVTGSRDGRLQDNPKTTTTATPCNDGVSLLRLIRDLRKVTFRLEEDGHIAKLNITPTRIDASCVFPETEYEAWYYRNVLRGNQRVYTVEVSIEA